MLSEAANHILPCWDNPANHSALPGGKLALPWSGEVENNEAGIIIPILRAVCILTSAPLGFPSASAGEQLI
ncbi:hypothetical protein NQZ68_011961 [Dissostichus eleginoides]|nr:hypothetical protein NQZ68_011961 [Dissostichus eleginoides]